MKGAIEYLREVSRICREHKGDCWMCPLGRTRALHETICPRLTSPDSWTDKKTTEMVRIGGSK